MDNILSITIVFCSFISLATAMASIFLCRSEINLMRKELKEFLKDVEGSNRYWYAQKSKLVDNEK